VSFDGAPYADAEWTASELVQGQVPGFLVNELLLMQRTLNTLWAGQPVPQQEDGADNGVYEFKKVLEEKSHNDGNGS